MVIGWRLPEIEEKIMKTISAYLSFHENGRLASAHPDLSGLLPWAAAEIAANGMRDVEEFEVGDRVTCELWRGSVENDEGISSGGSAVTKSGSVESVSKYGMFVEFDDGDRQAMEKYNGCSGYPCMSVTSEVAK